MARALEWYNERSQHTKAYDQWLLLQLIGSTITDVARKEETTYDVALGALHRQIAVEANGLSCFDSFLTTMENWMDAITNYFVSRLSSGFVEGFNNKVKVLKRRC